MDELAALLAERERYETWLRQLDAKRAATPQHVFDRVHTDYAARLSRVTDQLAGRASELQATASELAARIASLYAEETTRRDERAEAELRAAVGEYTVEQTGEIVELCDTEIARLEGERSVLGAELARIQDILAQVTKAPAEHSSEPVSAVAEAPASAVESAPPPASIPVAGFDDLAFLQSLGQPQSAAAAPTPASEPPAPEMGARDATPENAPPVAAESTHALDEEDLIIRPGVLTSLRPETGSGPAVDRAPSGRERGGEGRLHPSLTPGSLPAFLKEMPTEQIKTLKCQECGTMNYPTEWYCERCGGELATL